MGYGFQGQGHYAIFDNIAWVCMLEAGGALSPLKVSLFKKDCEPFIPPDCQPRQVNS